MLANKISGNNTTRKSLPPSLSLYFFSLRVYVCLQRKKLNENRKRTGFFFFPLVIDVYLVFFPLLFLGGNFFFFTFNIGEFVKILFDTEERNYYWSIIVNWEGRRGEWMENVDSIEIIISNNKWFRLFQIWLKNIIVKNIIGGE